MDDCRATDYYNCWIIIMKASEPHIKRRLYTIRKEIRTYQLDRLIIIFRKYWSIRYDERVRNSLKDLIELLRVIKKS